MAKKSIDEIVEDKHPTFANMMKEIGSAAELDKNLIIYLKQKEGLTMQKARDEELLNLKERKAELSKPYNQTIGALKKMMSCIYTFGHKFENEIKEEFEKNLVAYARQLAAVKREKDNDAKLKAISEAISDINGDYDPTINLLGLKCDYIAWLIKERFDVDEPKVEI